MGGATTPMDTMYFSASSTFVSNDDIMTFDKEEKTIDRAGGSWNKNTDIFFRCFIRYIVRRITRLKSKGPRLG